MEMTVVTEINEDGQAKKKSKNDARLLLVWVLCLPLNVMHQVTKNAIVEVIFTRNGFYNRIKKMKEIT